MQSEMAYLTTHESAEKTVHLLNMLLEMQTAQDELPRAPIGKFGAIDDELTKAVHEAAMFIFAAQQAIPLREQLAARGRELEAQGAIQVGYGDSYSAAALNHLLKK